MNGSFLNDDDDDVLCCVVDAAVGEEAVAVGDAQPPQKRQRLEESFFGDMFTPENDSRINEVDLYLISPETDTLLTFWKSKSSQWPRLSNIARTILAIPATETSSERVFSIAGRTLEDRRSRLNVGTVDDLLFLHGLH